MTTPAGGGVAALRRRKAGRPAPPRAGERCEFCAADLGHRHGHVADTADHRLLCVCRPCYLLFAPRGAGGGRYRAVEDEVRVVSDLAVDDTGWEALRIPVDLAFAFRQTGEDRLLVFYPGPGGATESLLDVDAWADVAAANPVLDTLLPDVEAALVRKHDDRYTCHLVPVDVCYELVGLVRLHWTGLAGGSEVWRRIDAFFAGLDRRARPVVRAARRD